MKRHLNSKKASKAHGLAVILALFAATTLTACKGGGLFNGKLFKERSAEKPAPTDDGIEKSFFVDASGKPKTFLCAIAPELGRGDAGEESYTSFVNETAHCNIEFEVTENYLVGKLIQPSFLNDRSRWEEMLRIPIKSHYYYEHAKDPHGRETNEWIENSSRSHWSARPMMKLDLTGLQLGKLGTAADAKAISVEDIEWDRQRNFLGFSVNAEHHEYRGGGRWITVQGRYRVNFLKFEHDPSFEKVPYNLENSRYMNILHVLGRRIEGTEQELYAGHWDLRKPTTIYLNGVPAEHEKTVRAAIEKWNVALREIGAIGKDQVAFNVEVRNSKHPFDLRYPAINWISDKRISAKSPLGIGMAHADVRNGKIIWGGVSIFGGMLENYINRYTPIEATGSGMVDGMTPFQSFVPMINPTMKPMERLEQANAGARASLIDNMSVDLRKYLEGSLAAMSKDGKSTPEQMQAIRDQMQKLARGNPALNKIVADLIDQSRQEANGVNGTFARTNILKILGQRLGRDTKINPREEAAKARPELANALKEKDLSRRALVLKGMNNINNSARFVELERTAENMSGSWMASEAQRTRNYPDMLESVVMDLTLHEFGHMIGLGHQFKENIVPEEGTVPSRFVKELNEKATEEKGFTNYTSVMGYRSGRTEMILPSADLAPGPHDKLVLRYLYRDQFATYDKNADDFVYLKVPANGKIPALARVKSKSGQVTNLPVSYFPQCNDFEASLDADPFCNRWDRGSKAEDIIKSYFEYVSDNLLASLYNVVGGGGMHWYYEYRLWNLSLSQFSRARLFYDEMRRRLRSEPDLIPIWNELRMDKNSLFEFSQGCQKPDPTSSAQVKSGILRRLFAHKDIVDLCRANAIALKEFGFFLNLPDGDYTKIDHKNRFVSGGYLEGDANRERSFDNFIGSWYQLSNFPLKFSSLFTLTSADPFQFDPYYGITPNYYFDSAENRYLYRTLYPREYTRLISSSVQNNMRFTATGMSPINSIGKTILATSSLLPYQRFSSNDSARLPGDFNEMLDQQTQFQLSMVAVILTAVKPDTSSGVKADHYKKFTASVYDFFTGKSTTATEVFIMPKGNVIVWANGMFLYPVTRLKFYEGTNSYVIAYKVAFDYEEGDQLVEDSVKYALNDKHTEIARICMEGFNRNGLASYFDSANSEISDENNFEGFYIPQGIAEEIGKEKTKLFYDSIESSFAKYDKRSLKGIPANFPLHSMRQVCDQAILGIGEISASAALLNGFWLNITADFMEK